MAIVRAYPFQSAGIQHYRQASAYLAATRTIWCGCGQQQLHSSIIQADRTDNRKKKRWERHYVKYRARFSESLVCNRWQDFVPHHGRIRPDKDSPDQGRVLWNTDRYKEKNKWKRWNLNNGRISYPGWKISRRDLSCRMCIVCLDTGWKTQQDRNRLREAVVPQDAIGEMVGKMRLSELHEARKVEWICQ